MKNRLVVLLWLGVASATYVVERSPRSRGETLVLQVCAGLMNRAMPQSVYVVPTVGESSKESEWYSELYGAMPSPIPYDRLVKECLVHVKGMIKYDYVRDQRLMPQIITYSGTLDLLPLTENLYNLSVVIDVATRFKGMSVAEATMHVFDEVGQQTQMLAFLNPGYDVHGSSPIRPPLVPRSHEEFKMVDLAVKDKAFGIFLLNGCIPATPEHRVLEAIVRQAPWPKPIATYGYLDMWSVAGNLFEAPTFCTDERVMGAVPTLSARNLAFHSGAPRIEKGELIQRSNVGIEYDPQHTYLSFVMGDGDNLAFVHGVLFDQVRARKQLCRVNTGGANICSRLPLIWTVSPHALDLAPDLVRWFYNNSNSDHWTLPPSGYLYGYAGSMKDTMQASFVQKTEDAAERMDTVTSVVWEWFGTWKRALSSYIPRYGVRRLIQGCFAVSVPYLFPIIEVDRLFEIVDGVVVFVPILTWYEVFKDRFNARDVATRVNELPRGSVGYVYVAADIDLNELHAVAQFLMPHVRVIGSEAELVRLAKTRRFIEFKQNAYVN